MAAGLPVADVPSPVARGRRWGPVVGQRRAGPRRGCRRRSVDLGSGWGAACTAVRGGHRVAVTGFLLCPPGGTLIVLHRGKGSFRSASATGRRGAAAQAMTVGIVGVSEPSAPPRRSPRRHGLEDDGRRTALRGRAGSGLVALWADMGGPDRRTAAERTHFSDWR